MVDIVSNTAGSPRAQRPSTQPAGKEAIVTPGNGMPQSQKTAPVQKTGGASESLSISDTAKTLPSELRAGPPIEIETVERIREAIDQNKYPIDLQAITESLFQSFLEVSR